MKLFGENNPIVNVLIRIFDVFLLNLLWILCSVPIITIGASTAALYYSLLKINRETDSSIIGMFFKSFRQNLKQGCLVTLLFILSGLVLYVDIMFCNLLENTAGNILRVIFALFILIWAMMLSYVFPILAQFENSVIGTIKNAFLMSVSHVGRTLVIVSLNALIPVVFFVLPELFVLGLPVLMTFGVAIIALINTKLLTGIFDYYINLEG